MFAVSEGKVMNRGPTLERGLVSGLLQVDALLNTVSVKDSNGGVVIAEIFVRPNCDIFVILITGIIIGVAREGISSISGTRFILQKDIVLFPFR
jgi:hypothetical protein